MIVTFDGFKEKQKELEDYKKSILKLIDEFITTDEEFKKNHTNMGTPYKGSFDFYIDNLRRGDFIIQYNFGTFSNMSDEIYLNNLEYRRLEKFMKDPETYRQSKKYNI